MNENKKIKILVDAHVFDYSFQGTTTYIKGMYNSLVELDDLDITLCSSDIDKLKKYFPSKKFKFIKLNTNSKIKRLLFEFPKIIDKWKFDYVHFQYIVPLFNKKCKYINTIHDVLFLDYKEYFPWSYRFVRKNLFRYSAQRSDIIMTVSEYSKKDICIRFKINPDRVFVTPNAITLNNNINLEIRKKYKLRDYIHYVSRFEPRKNQIGLLKAYLSLKLYDKGYDLVFIGRHSDKIEIQAYEQLISSIPKDVVERIHFLDNVNEEELIGFYKESSCFVYPSFAEGFGIPPLEAGVNNCKVLCSNQTAMSDFTFFKYLFDPNNFSEFRHKLNEVLLDREYPYEKIKTDILAKYNWNEVSVFFKNLLK